MTPPYNFLEKRDLKGLAKQNRKVYSKTQPFPHVVIDNFLPEEGLKNVLKEFPGSGQAAWERVHTPGIKKLRSNNIDQLGSTIRFLFHQLNSSIFIDFLETLTGIDGLIPDPHYFNSGLHRAEKGCYFKIHTDFNWHPKLSLYHRLNLILYLNEDWQDEYNGHLELWNRDMTRCEKRIMPIFNRCIIFASTDFSYHGYPEPLACPEGQARKSLALYYYTARRPTEEISTIPHLAQFQARPGEKIPVTTKTVVKKLAPPLLIDVLKHVRKSI